MTVQTDFWDWGRNPLTPDPRRCAPIGVTWRDHLLATWGGQDLGCYAARPVTGGTTPSDHASGAAIDWRYEAPGMGRAAMLDQVMPWLIDNSRELGVQAIHDYVGCRIWRPPGTSGRPTSPSPECGWRPQTPGSQMGQPWAQWLHIACLNTRWNDPRTIAEMLTIPPAPPDPDPEDDTMPKAAVYQPNDDPTGPWIWWDGTACGWVRDAGWLPVGRVMGTYANADDNPLMNFNAAQIRQMIESSWSGGPYPPGYDC